jgi:tetratricopeptide (TPR) repeat protein
MAAQIEAEATKADQKLAEQLEAAREKDDCPAIVKLVRPHLGKGKLYPPLELIGFELGTFCARRNGDVVLARRWAMQATALPEASDFLWRLRLVIDIYDANYVEAVRTVEAMQDGRGAALNSVRPASLYDLLRGLSGDTLKAERRRLLAVLGSSAYIPDEPVAWPSADGFRQDYAEILVEEGKKAEAQAVIAQITNIDTMLSLLLDPRFKGLIATSFDERSFTERELAMAQNARQNNDDSLKQLVASAGLLRKLGRFKEAMAVLQTAKAREGGPEAYADADENLNWWWDAMSRTHLALGEADAAIAALHEGAAKSEDGGLNVSQTINLSQVYVALRRPVDALKILEPAKSLNVSPYGAMQIRMARGCAAAQVGDLPLANENLAFAKEHKTDAPMAYVSLLLCTGNLDGAAAAIIARLDDEKERGRALLSLADFDVPPPPLSNDPGYIALEAVKARADVRAAIQKAGGSRRIRLQDASW